MPELRSAVPHARSDSGSDTTAHPQPARADRAGHRSALRHRNRMEPLLKPTLGNLPPARRRAGHGLNDRSPSPSGRAREQPGWLGEVVRDGQYRHAPGHPGRGPAYTLDRYRTADDRAVEAMLASVREPCTASQLANGLEWTLPRTVDALEHLEAALANTGQTLTRIGHRYMLGPRAGLLHNREIGRCLRHTRDPVDLTTATVLHRPHLFARGPRPRRAQQPCRARGR
jgi:hypothetical protein